MKIEDSHLCSKSHNHTIKIYCGLEIIGKTKQQKTLAAFVNSSVGLLIKYGSL